MKPLKLVRWGTTELIHQVQPTIISTRSVKKAFKTYHQINGHRTRQTFPKQALTHIFKRRGLSFFFFFSVSFYDPALTANPQRSSKTKSEPSSEDEDALSGSFLTHTPSGQSPVARPRCPALPGGRSQTNTPLGASLEFTALTW